MVVVFSETSNRLPRKTLQVEQIKAQFHHFSQSEVVFFKEIFHEFDADKSGDIDLDELRSAIRAIKTSTDDTAIEQMLAIADGDGSGSIDFEEFKELMSLRRRAAV